MAVTRQSFRDVCGIAMPCRTACWRGTSKKSVFYSAVGGGSAEVLIQLTVSWSRYQLRLLQTDRV